LRNAAGALAHIVLGIPLMALVLAGCNTTGSGSSSSLNGSRSATVAFESIDGPPRDVFDRLVQNLNVEAQTRQLAVVSRTDSSAYRVRGYLVAEGSAKQSAINWIWDVYDGRRQRVLRIAGQQTIRGEHRDAWQALDGATVQKIAQDSMGQLAAFLNSADATSSTPSQVAYGRESSPEAAGIFRIFTASPARPDATATVADADQAGEPDVPLPPDRARLTRSGGLTLATAESN
jgi:hypothetical protein